MYSFITVVVKYPSCVRTCPSAPNRANHQLLSIPFLQLKTIIITFIFIRFKYISNHIVVPYKWMHKQVFPVEIFKLMVFLFVFCFRSVYLDLDEEAFANIKDSVKELWNLIG